MNEIFSENLLDLEFTAPFAPSSGASLLPEIEKTSAEKYLIFFLNEEIFAISAKCVKEVIAPPPITPLPNTPGWFSGIANLRGKIISVIDLPRLWNREDASLPKSKLVLLNSKTTDSHIAFAVDKVGELVVLQNTAIRYGCDDPPYFCGKIEYKSRIINLLDAQKLFPR